MLKQQEQKDKLKAKGVESRGRGGAPGHQGRHQDILLHAPYFLLMGHWWVTHSYLLSLQLWGDASSTSLSDILPPKWLLFIGSFPSLSRLLGITPRIFALQSLLGPCCVSCLLSPLCRWNSSISTSITATKLGPVCLPSSPAQSMRGKPWCHCHWHEAQRFPALLASHTGSAGTRLRL